MKNKLTFCNSPPPSTQAFFWMIGVNIFDHNDQKQIKTHSIIRVEDVGGRRVIQDEGFVEVSAQAAQIFDIAALVEYARFPE